MNPLINTGAEPDPRDLLINPAPPDMTTTEKYYTKQTLRPLRFRERLLLFPPIHATAYAFRWVGLRDRLRCPLCKAVGTWKPHGTLSARWIHHDRPVRRWLCKWCGHYLGPEGALHCFPDLTRGCWVLPHPFDPDSPVVACPTTQDVIAKTLVQGSGKPVWPWRG
jgi:hypothetical protein